MKQNIKINLLDANIGQIEGLPANPRFIKDDQFKKLKQSIIDDPEMMDIRECMVIPHGKRFVVFGGNMRREAVLEIIKMPQAEFDKIVESKRDNEWFLTWFTAIMLLRDKKEVPCKVVDPNTAVEKLKAYTIKDNVGFGDWDWDMIYNEWPTDELQDWGLDLKLPKAEKDPEDVNEAQAEYKERFEIIVECTDEEDQQIMYEKLKAEGYTCRILTL